MAIFEAYSPINMRDNLVWYGYYSVANTTQITITDGWQTTTLYGSFYYDAYDRVDLNSIIYGIYVDASMGEAYVYDIQLTVADYNYYLSDGNNLDLLQRLTQGNDSFYGSYGIDIGFTGTGDDIIFASGGDDSIDGGTGTDTYNINGVDSGAVSVLQVSGGYSVSSYQGTDLLYSVEKISLADGLFNLADLVIPKDTETASPGYRYFPVTGDDLIDAMTHGYTWDLGPDRTIDFAVANGFNYEYWIDPQAVLEHLAAALELVSYYSDVSFNNLGFYGDPSLAYDYGSEITLAVDGSYISSYYGDSVWAIGNFPNSLEDQYFYDGFGGDIFLNINSEANYLPSYEPGSAGWALLLHELGHVLGLKHPHDDGGTGRPTFSDLDLQDFDIDFATVMSYNDEIDWNQISFDPATPMILDVLALQYLFGKNFDTNSDDTIHNLSEMEGFYVTVWDAEGKDTVDATATRTGWQIQLPDSTDSTLIDTKVGAAFSVNLAGEIDLSSVVWLAGDIEQATGSAFNDELYGNDFNNLLDGGAGDDTLFDGLGNDRVFGGDGDDLLYNIGGQDSFDGGLGTDTLITDLSSAIDPNSFIVKYDSTNALLSRFMDSSDRDEIIGIENFQLSGSFDTVVIGDDADNQYQTDSGNDRIAGGIGIDIIYSGTGNDLIIFRDAAEFGDIITDFSSSDTIDLSYAAQAVLGDSYVKEDVLRFVQVAENTSLQISIEGIFTQVALLEGVNTTDLSLDQVVLDYRPWQGQTYHWASHTLIDNAEIDLQLLKQEVPLGDTETGRVISAADALAALKIAVGINPNSNGYAVSPYQYIAADVNQDGRVSAADALAVLKMAVNLDSAPDREWLLINERADFYDESTQTYTISRTSVDWNQIRQDSVSVDDTTNLVAVLRGDVNGNWIGNDGASNLSADYFTALEQANVGPAEQWWVV